jgi:hypothetical protein
LKKKGGFPNARLSSNENEGASDDASSEDPVEFIVARY